MNHACEFETSLYLALRSDLVDMGKAVRELGHRPTKNYWTDLIAGDGPLAMMEHWSQLSASGVMGDPTKASAEKGRALLEAAAVGIVALVDELLARESPPRVDHHKREILDNSSIRQTLKRRAFRDVRLAGTGDSSCSRRVRFGSLRA